MNSLLCIGLGYSAGVLAARLKAKGWAVAGTSRNAEGVAAMAARGYRAFLFDGSAPLPEELLTAATHIVVSVPPDQSGDPVLRACALQFAAHASHIRWLAYLSTTGVYGDHGGGWVTEETPLAPATLRGARRLAAEAGWLALHRDAGLPVHIFRLAGIYGPGRNQLDQLRNGTARRIVKEGQVFSRIHVEDIATVLEASIARPNPGRAYNVCDDEPCPPQEVVAHAARLLGLPPPPEIPFAAAQLSPMAQTFYAESKKVSNARIREELGVSLRYPSYREGLAALMG